MDARSLRIVFFGTPEFAVAPLRALIDGGFNVVGVVTAPDKPSGRGLKLSQSAVKTYAIEAGLNVLQPPKLKEDDFICQLRDLRADLGIVIAFRMLPRVIWSMPRLGTFNLHASLLPQYRGAAPINWAIINGETVTGVTTFMLNDQIDTGDIIARMEEEITLCDTATTLYGRLMNIGARLVVDTVEQIAQGGIVAEKQSDEQTPLRDAPKIFHEDCRVDWTGDTQSVYNFIRGLAYYPAAWTTVVPKDGGDAVSMKVYFADTEKCCHNMPAGTIVSDGRKYIKVACADGYVILRDLQLSSKKRMKTEEFLCGFKDISSYTFL